MHIGILQTGHVPKDLLVPSYPAMISSALGSAFTYSQLDVTRGELPSRSSAIDGYVITGSASGVHDGDPWISEFKGWLKDVDPTTPIVGICFGHQIMADAYGGVVEKSDQGWVAGLCEYRVVFQEEWMDDAVRFVIPAFNRDHVVKAPPASRDIATSAFCDYAALSYRERRALSFQGHPEFAPDFAANLLDRCERKGVIDSTQAARARELMRQPDDCYRVIQWIRRFFQRTAC